MILLAALVASALAVLGYVPYVRDILRGCTRPHVITWFTWTLATGVTVVLQLSDGAGMGALVTASAASISGFIFVLGLRQGAFDITKFDIVCLVLALGSLYAWLVADNLLQAALFACAADALGFLPTIRKSRQNPFSETLSSYVVNAVRFTIALVALERFTAVTLLYPATWLAMNAAFATYLVILRQKTSGSKEVA